MRIDYAKIHVELWIFSKETNMSIPTVDYE